MGRADEKGEIVVERSEGQGKRKERETCYKRYH
jgi:hypothetical protein